jgi:hypothetical protein
LKQILGIPSEFAAVTEELAKTVPEGHVGASRSGGYCTGRLRDRAGELSSEPGMNTASR